MEHPMRKPNDLSRSLTVLKGDSTVIAVIEMSLTKWLVAGVASIVPGVERQPLKKLEVDESALLNAARSLAGGSEKSRTQDRTHRGRI
jgi:transposase